MLHQQRYKRGRVVSDEVRIRRPNTIPYDTIDYIKVRP